MTKFSCTGTFFLNALHIKNVLFNFLIMPKNSTGRTQTLQALAASLGFTNEELNKVRSVQKL